jgi:hypothetical protein
MSDPESPNSSSDASRAPDGVLRNGIIGVSVCCLMGGSLLALGIGKWIGSRRLDHQVKAVTRQTPGTNLPFRLLVSLTQRLQKQVVNLIVHEDRFPTISTTHHMLDRARPLNFEHSRQPLNRPILSAEPHQALKAICSDPRMCEKTEYPGACVTPALC